MKIIISGVERREARGCMPPPHFKGLQPKSSKVFLDKTRTIFLTKYHCSYPPKKEAKSRDSAQFFRNKIPSDINRPLTVLISRGVKSSGDIKFI